MLFRSMELYYVRSFDMAARKFEAVLKILPEDFCAKMLLDRCTDYAQDPPPDGWDGVEVMKTK